eukprot:NODE_383_length_9627_cov_0.480793.p3 type:complete len:248 gc:universal NODE_383_length_9627_cov_0.480793:146-889(+)
MTKVTVDIDRYDRQIRLFGLEGQHKIGACKVLVYNTGIQGSEMIKNLVLAGVHSCSIYNNTAGMFHKDEFEIDRVTRLNPRCNVALVDGIDENYDVIIYGHLKDEPLVFKHKCMLYVCIEQLGNAGWFRLTDKPIPFIWTFNGEGIKPKLITRKLGSAWPIVYAILLGNKTNSQIQLQLKRWNVPIDESFINVVKGHSVQEHGLANIISGFAAQETLEFISKGSAKLGAYSVDGFNLQVRQVQGSFD